MSAFHLKRIAAGLIGALLAISINAQESARTIEWANHAIPNGGRVPEPFSKRIDDIELEEILIDGRSILVGEPFVGDVRDLSFRVKNVSTRPIGFVQITVILPELEHPPQIPFVLPKADGKTSKPLLPGEQSELRVPQGAIYDWVKDTVASQGKDLRSIKKASIYVVVLDSQNSGGCIKTRDARNQCPPK